MAVAVEVAVVSAVAERHQLVAEPQRGGDVGQAADEKTETNLMQHVVVAVGLEQVTALSPVDELELDAAEQKQKQKTKTAAVAVQDFHSSVKTVVTLGAPQGRR